MVRDGDIMHSPSDSFWRSDDAMMGIFAWGPVMRNIFPTEMSIWELFMADYSTSGIVALTTMTIVGWCRLNYGRLVLVPQIGWQLMFAPESSVLMRASFFSGAEISELCVIVSSRHI